MGQEIDFVQLDEKNKAGFAIADFNNNNLDDVVFGTDENKVYLMYEGEEIAEGFPFIGNDKFKEKFYVYSNTYNFASYV